MLLAKKLLTCILCCFFCTAFGCLCAPTDNADYLFDLSLEELFNISIQTVSRNDESLHDTPATVMVITREMIRKRGYKEFSEIFDDLPGMEIIRPFGDTWIAHFWRGTNQRGGTVLLLLDGNVMNHLYFDNTFVQSAFSLANIKQVEVVLGPAAVAYGDNAFLGTINVITQAASLLKGNSTENSFNGFITTGSNQRRIIDFHQSLNSKNWHFNLAVRLDKGQLDDSNNFEYTRPDYYSDSLLWGDFVNNRQLGGRRYSPHSNKSIDLRLAYQSTELSLQHFEIDSGYGNVYAADRVQNTGPWIRPDSALSLRHQQSFGEALFGSPLQSTSQLRWRHSDIDNDSIFVEGFPFPDIPGGRLIDVSYWRSINRSQAFYQDFTYQGDQWHSAFGFRYVQKDLQKAYDVTRGENPFITPSSLTDWRDYDFPAPPVTSSIANNRINTTEKSLYFMFNQALTPQLGILSGDQHLLNLGVRFENHSTFGSQPIFKAGYVIKSGNTSYKLTWGESFQEPSPRLLYGGWQGAGNDPELNPEEASTWELSWHYITEKQRLSLTLVEVKLSKTISLFAGGASNSPANQTLRSLDLISQKTFDWSMGKTTVWFNYSHLFNVYPVRRAATLTQSLEQNRSTGPSGDVAQDKLMLGVELAFSNAFSTTLANRYISSRHTSALNPIARIPGYFVSDIHLRWPKWFKQVDLSVKITNLFDKRYFHPGVNNGDSGDQPGFFNADDVWIGSSGFFNSLLPQPGREIFVGIEVRF